MQKYLIKLGKTIIKFIDEVKSKKNNFLLFLIYLKILIIKIKIILF